MGGDRSVVSPPSVAPLSAAAAAAAAATVSVFDKQDQHLSNFDSSVNAVSFGFVATAVLILMFLVMAIFERFLRPRPSSSAAAAGRNHRDLESQMMKLDYPSPKMTIYAKGVSVLMPGEETPTFIAHPAPAPCPPECISQPLHQCVPSSSTTNTS